MEELGEGPLRAGGGGAEVGREVTKQHKSCLRELFNVELPLRLSRAELELCAIQTGEPRSRAGGKVALCSRRDKGSVTSSSKRR